jgi:hypothetical protein
MEQKKKYFTPWMEVMFVKTVELMRAGDPSDTPNIPGALGAPERQQKAF